MTLYGRPDKTTNILGGDGVSVIESPLNPTQSVPVVALGDHLELVIRNRNKINSNGLLIVVNQKITIVGNRKIDILSNLDFLVDGGHHSLYETGAADIRSKTLKVVLFDHVALDGHCCLLDE
jgi:hypothetical protein